MAWVERTARGEIAAGAGAGVGKRRRVGPVALFQIAVHLAALAPLALLIWDALHANLTANPIQALEQRTGKIALALLVVSLACTPANTLLRFRPAVRWRRPLGLYAFLYAALHFLIFIGLDYGLDLRRLREAIFEKRYALVGFAAFLILLPLAVTSTKAMMRRMGRRWTRLHRLVYIAAPLVVLHYAWSVKSDIRVPLLYGAIILLLLALRTRPVRRGISRLSRSSFLDPKGFWEDMSP